MDNDNKKNNKLKSKIIETYTQDMAKAIENDKGGLIKKIIQEEEKRGTRNKNLSPRSRKNKLFMLISIILVLSAVFVLVFLVFLKKKINTVPIEPQFTSIIFTDQTSFKAIDGLNKNQIEKTISNQIDNSEVKIGGVEGIYLTENKKIIGFKKFITLIESNSVLDETNLINNHFLLGVVNDEIKPKSTTKNTGVSTIKTNKDFFILLKVRSFSDIFPVMRSWENKILYDLYGFFGISLSPETNYLFVKNFKDSIVLNKNARVLKDNNNKIVLMYVYANENSIIITSSEQAVGEIIRRLNTGKIKK